MSLRAQFKMLILALHISSILDFKLVQLLVQDLLSQSFLKVTTCLEHARRCYVESILLKWKHLKLFLTGLFSLKHFIQFSFVTFWFCEITWII